MRKIKKTQSTKKVIVISCAIALFLIGSGITIYTYQKDQDDKSAIESTDKPNLTIDNEGSGDATDNKDQNSATKDNENPNPGYISTPIEQPSTTTPFPIENEHYKITQESAKNYTVTLYPIVNNPEYTDYTAQLKDYKKEALDYLQSRLGDVSALSITWIPDDASAL